MDRDPKAPKWRAKKKLFLNLNACLEGVARFRVRFRSAVEIKIYGF
jgi:hypothetical protein